MRRFLWPFLIFAALLVFLGVGLQRDPREVPSPLIGKAAPPFKLTQLNDAGKTISPRDFLGQVWLLNVWASWCVSCREEHPLLVEFARLKTVPMVGLNYKDTRAEGTAWLTQFGNPYVLSGFDDKGLVGIDYGVYGVPETFVIDQLGVIRMKHIGALTPQALREKLLPLIEKLNRH